MRCGSSSPFFQSDCPVGVVTDSAWMGLTFMVTEVKQMINWRSGSGTGILDLCSNPDLTTHSEIAITFEFFH